jgi:hypothetical protein
MGLQMNNSRDYMSDWRRRVDTINFIDGSRR